MAIKDKVRKWFSKARGEARVLRGKEAKDTIYYSRKKYKDESSAKEAFQRAVNRLFDVNNWNNIPSPASSKFYLYDQKGKPASLAKKDYFIKIELPGPTPENWVLVKEVKLEEDVAEFMVSPTADPLKNKKSKSTNHFFTHDARSSFRVTRKGKLLSAYEIGRDEYINNTGEEAGERKLINTALAEGGWLGFQRYQWKKITDYLVGNE